MGQPLMRSAPFTLLVLSSALLVGGCRRPAPSGGPFVQTACMGEVGDNPGQLSYPRCLDHDTDGLWVIDKLARVQRLDPATGLATLGWRMPAWENGKPTGLTVWKPPAGGPTRIIIPDTHYHRVMIYDPEALAPGADPLHEGGKLIGQFGQYGEGDAQFIYPTDVAVLPTPDGRGIARLYVSEYGGHDRISVFAPSPGAQVGDEREFQFQFAFGRPGSGASAEPLEFNRPQSLVIDLSRRELIVTDACNHRVGRLTLEGRLIAWFSSMGDGIGELKYPYGLALCEDHTIFVTEFGGNRVQRFDPETGASLGIYGTGGRHDGELASPWAITVLGSTVYVLDSGSNRIKGFELPSGRTPLRSAATTSAGGPG